MSFVSFLFIVHIYAVTRNSLLSPLPPSEVVDKMGREGMARRDERRRLSERAARYGPPAMRGAQVSFIRFKLLCRFYAVTLQQLTPVVPPVLEARGEGWEVPGRRRRAGKFCIVSNYCAYFTRLTRNSLPRPSCPSTRSTRQAGRAAWRAGPRGGSRRGTGRPQHAVGR